MWFRKRTEAAHPKRHNGFFSTEGNFQIDNPLQRFRRMQEAMEQTLNQPALCPVNEAGHAMDSIETPSLKVRNTATGYMPETQFSWYCGQGFIGWQACALISQNWFIKKACAMPAKDAARNGYETTINDGTEADPEILDYIRDQDKRFEVLRNCVEFIDLGRTFGIRVALFEVDSPDPQYYAKPFNPDGVRPGSYKGISQIDPYWITPEMSAEAASNPAASDFYEPTWWRINGKRVHRTHLVIFRNGNLPDILKPGYLYGGLPVPQLIAERVYAAERTANEAPMLAMTKRLTVLKCDTDQVAANPEGFTARLTQWTQWMSNYGVKVIGLDEEVNQIDTSLAELDAAIMTQFQIACAGAEVPATKMLGTQPKGFNATGEYEEASYHEMLSSLQQHNLSPLVNRHHLILMRSHVAPKFKIQPFSTEVVWNELDEQTTAEQADTELKKAQAAAHYVEMGAVDGYDVRQKLIADKDSGFNGIEPVVEGGPGDRDAELEVAKAQQSAGSEVNPTETAE